MKPTEPKRYASAFDFFLAHAGYSYDPKTETQEEGRRRRARLLADAEVKATALGLIAQWHEDDNPDRSFMDADAGGDYDDEDRRCAEFYLCEILSPEGESLEILGSIHEDIRDPVGARYYRRVVEAELFLQALERVEVAP
jgi:hypothetical protein